MLLTFCELDTRVLSRAVLSTYEAPGISQINEKFMKTYGNLTKSMV